VNLLVTGGCGFIGSNFIEYVINKKHVRKVINVDKLSYAGSVTNTDSFKAHGKYIHENYCLSDYSKVRDTFEKHNITQVIHLAAETHVDNSINSSKEFIESNVTGTHALLEAAKEFKTRFHHVSTDEVYGEALGDQKFTSETPYNPRNPYSATKAASDMLVKAYVNTYGIHATISNCSNNYGPRQHSEKFIPTVIRSLLADKKVPVYGEGKNVRDWIHVEDHCRALLDIANHGEQGETYLVGCDCEKSNLEVVQLICDLLGKDFTSSVDFVTDRLGHDFRYAIDNTKTIREINWEPKVPFTDGLRDTIEWYESN
tara:strand:+ start:720 stop:1661 length:942 start_codon:yes stop_codon:yes gene_type:complete